MEQSEHPGPAEKDVNPVTGFVNTGNAAEQADDCQAGNACSCAGNEVEQSADPGPVEKDADADSHTVDQRVY